VKVVAVVGARPNFVKIAPVLSSLGQYPEVRCTLVHTGQHYDGNMSQSFFRELEIPEPDVNLGVGSGNSTTQTAEVMLRLEPVLASERPDVVVVVGDVNSTAAAAIVAAKANIPVAHIEAGLRSFDRTMPEEINRVLTDSVSTYCFTTEPAANENLAREGVSPESIHYVGNVMIDTLFRFRERAASSRILETFGVTPREFVVLTLHRPSNVDHPGTLAAVLAAIAPIADAMPVIFPVHPRTRQRLRAEAGTATARGIRLTDPLGYLDFLQLMANARCILTDSGGIQEETTALGVPCLTLRQNTERPITVTEGTNRLVGRNPQTIRRAWQDIRRGAWPQGRLPELWDGKAADRIARELVR